MNSSKRKPLPTLVGEFARASVPTLAELSLTAGSAILLVLSFPDFDLWPLAWIALVPLLIIVSINERPASAFLLGWSWGVIFFYGSCWWLTFPMIHYGHISAWLAYPLLLFPVALVGLFPALFCLLLVRLVTRFGQIAIFTSPLVWISLELARYLVTGQVWNALGYSQAFHPFLIQSARWGGVYAVGFLIVMSNAAIAYALLRITIPGRIAAVIMLMIVALVVAISHLQITLGPEFKNSPRINIVAVQPNVPMEGLEDSEAMQQLLNRHLQLSRSGLTKVQDSPTDLSLVVWPESPMNFSYSGDSHLRDVIGDFARSNHASVLLNSLEPAPEGGEYNSAILINQEGQKVAQYDKIRLMPFGEYVPLPRWLPGASSVRGIVGEFTPGSSYTLMPLGAFRAGVFICVEAAHPSIARTFTDEGVDILINISNDGYLGPTPVMRQHLANAVFRAVENDRDVVRVTNAGISAYISSNGSVWNQTPGFQQAVRTWTIRKDVEGTTFYSRHGDVFVYGCALITLGIASATFMSKRKRVSEARP